MAAPTGDGGGSPLSGCYLLLVLSEPHRADHRPLILQRVVKGLSSWDQRECGVDLGQELQALIEANPDGEQFKFGERLIQFATENVVAEILVNPQVYTFQQCLKNMLASFTRHRHLIHAGYVFSGNGSWILQDGTFSGSDLLDALRETDVQRVTRAYESSLSVHIHCPEEGIWRSEALLKDPVFAASKVSMNPPDRDAAPPQVAAFREYLSGFLVPASLEELLCPSDVVGNIRFSRPTLYVFPGGQGDAAMFGINGFNILFDGGFSRRACCWNFVRHLDRLDAVLMSRLNNGNLMGMSAMLQRKVDNATYPQMGHFFANLVDQKSSVDVDKDADPLLVNTQLEAQRLLDNLKALSLKPTPCLRENSNDPINLYHKVGHGRLDLFVLNPQKDANEMQAFLKSWTDGPDQSRVTLRVKGREFPVANLASICCLLVWVPDDRHDTVTRLLFPGSTPQQKVFEGLDRLKHLDFMKTPVCYVKSLGVRKHKTLDTLIKSGSKAPPAGTRVERIERVEVEQKRRVRSTSRQTRNGDATDSTKKPDRGDKELLAEIKAKKQEANRERAEKAPAAKSKPAKPEKAEPPKEVRPVSVPRQRKKKAPTDDNKQADDSSEGKNGSIASLPKDEKEATPVKAKKDVSNKMIVEEKKVSRTTTKAKQTKAETKVRSVESRVTSKVTETKTAKMTETKKTAEKVKTRTEPKGEKPTGARSRVKPPTSPKHARGIKPKAPQAIKPPATSTPKAKASQEQEVSTMRGTGDIEEVTMAGDMLTVTKVTTEVQRFIEEAQEGDSLEQMSGDFSREIETDSLELRKVDEKIDSLKQSPTTEDSKDLRQSSDEVLRRTDIEEAVLLRATSEHKSPPRPSEEQMKLTNLEKASAQKKDAVKTPDEVAELPEHEALELPDHEVQHLRTTEPVRSTDDMQRIMTTSHEPPTEEDTEKEKESVAEETVTSPKSEKDEINRRTKDNSPEEPPTEELPSVDAGGETRESLSPSPGYVEAEEPSPKNSKLEDIYTSPRREIYPIGEPYVESGVEAVTRHETVQRERAEMVMLASSTTTPSPSSPSRDRWTTEAPHLPSVDERSLEESAPRDISTASGATELSTVKIEDLYGDADKAAPETQVDVKDEDKKDTDIEQVSQDDLKTTTKEVTRTADETAQGTSQATVELAEKKDRIEEEVGSEKQQAPAEKGRSPSEPLPPRLQDDDEKIKTFLGEQAQLVQAKSPSELISATPLAQKTAEIQETVKPTVKDEKDITEPTVPSKDALPPQLDKAISDKADKDGVDKDKEFPATPVSAKEPEDVSPKKEQIPDQEPDITESEIRPKDISVSDKEASKVVTHDAKEEESFQPAVTSEKPSPQEPADSRDVRDDETRINAFLQEQASLAQISSEPSAVAVAESPELSRPLDIPSDDREKPTHEETKVVSDIDIRPSVEDSKELPKSEAISITKQVQDTDKARPVDIDAKKIPSPQGYDESTEESKDLGRPGSPDLTVLGWQDLEAAAKPDAEVVSVDSKNLKKPAEDEKHPLPDSKTSVSPQDVEAIPALIKDQTSTVQDTAKPSEHTPPTSPVHEKPSPSVSVSQELRDKSPEESAADDKRSPDVVKSPKKTVDLPTDRPTDDVAKVSPGKAMLDDLVDVTAKQVELWDTSAIPSKSPVKEAAIDKAPSEDTTAKSPEKVTEPVALKDVQEALEKIVEEVKTQTSKTYPAAVYDETPIAAFLQEQASLIREEQGGEAEMPKKAQAPKAPAPARQLTEPIAVEPKPVEDVSESGKPDQSESIVQRVEDRTTVADVQAPAASKADDTTVGDVRTEDQPKLIEKSATKTPEEKLVKQTIITQEYQEEKQISPEEAGQPVEEISTSSETSILGSQKTEVFETVQTTTYTSLDTSLTSVSSITKTEEKNDLDAAKQERKVSLTEQVSLVKPELDEEVKEVAKTAITSAKKTPSPEEVPGTTEKVSPEDGDVEKVDKDKAQEEKLTKDATDAQAYVTQPSVPTTTVEARATAPAKERDDEAKPLEELSAPTTPPTVSASPDKEQKTVPVKPEDTSATQPITELKSDLVKPAEVSLKLSELVDESHFDDKALVDAFMAEQAKLVEDSQPSVPIPSGRVSDTGALDTVSKSEEEERIDAFLKEQAELITDNTERDTDHYDVCDDHVTVTKTPESVKDDDRGTEKPRVTETLPSEDEKLSLEQVSPASEKAADVKPLESPEDTSSEEQVTLQKEQAARRDEIREDHAAPSSELAVDKPSDKKESSPVHIPDGDMKTSSMKAGDQLTTKEVEKERYEEEPARDEVREDHAAPSSEPAVEKSSDKKESSLVPTPDEDLKISSMKAEDQLTTRGVKEDRFEEEPVKADISHDAETVKTTTVAKPESTEVFQTEQVDLAKDKSPVEEGVPSKKAKLDADDTADVAVPTKTTDKTLTKIDTTPDSKGIIKPESAEKALLGEEAELVKDKTSIQEQIIVKETRTTVESVSMITPETPQKTVEIEQVIAVKEKVEKVEDVPHKDTKPVAFAEIDERIPTKQTDETVQEDARKSDTDAKIKPESPKRALQTEVTDAEDKTAVPEKVLSKDATPEAIITADVAITSIQTDETPQVTGQKQDGTETARAESPETAFMREQVELVRDKADVEEELIVKETQQTPESVDKPKPESPEKAFLREQAELVKDKDPLADVPVEETKSVADVTVAATRTVKETEDAIQKAVETPTARMKPESPESPGAEVEKLDKDTAAAPEQALNKEVKPEAAITSQETTPAKDANGALKKTDVTKSESPAKALLEEQVELGKEKADVHEEVIVKEVRTSLHSVVATKRVSPEKGFPIEQTDLVRDKTEIQIDRTSKQTVDDAVEIRIAQKADDAIHRTDKTPESEFKITPESPEKALQEEKADLEKLNKDKTVVSEKEADRKISPEAVPKADEKDLQEEKAELKKLDKDKKVVSEKEVDRKMSPEAVPKADETSPTKQVDETLQAADRRPDSTDATRPESPEKAFFREQAALVKEKAAVQEEVIVKEIGQTLASVAATEPESPEKAFLREQAELVADKTDVQDDAPCKEVKPDAGIKVNETSVSQTEGIIQKAEKTRAGDVRITQESPEKIIRGEKAELPKLDEDKTTAPEKSPRKDITSEAVIRTEEAIPTKQTDETPQEADQKKSSTETARAKSPQKELINVRTESVKDEGDVQREFVAEETAKISQSIEKTKPESPEKAFLKEQTELMKEKGPIHEDATITDTKPEVDIAVTDKPESPKKTPSEQTEPVKYEAGIKDISDTIKPAESTQKVDEPHSTVTERSVSPEKVSIKEQTKEMKETIAILPETPSKEPATITAEKTSTQQLDASPKKTDKTADITVATRPESLEKAFLEEQAELVRKKSSAKEDIAKKEAKANAEAIVQESIQLTKQTTDTVSVTSLEKVETSQSESTSTTQVSSSSSRQMTSSFYESDSAEMQPPSLPESTNSEVSVAGAQSKKTSYIIEEYEVISPRRRQQYEDVEEIVTYSPTARSRQVSEVTVVSSTDQQQPSATESQVSVETLTKETASLMQKTAGITAEESKPISLSVKADTVEMVHSGRSVGDVEETEETVSVTKSHDSYVEPPKRVDDLGASAEFPVRSSAGIEDLVSQIHVTEARMEKPIRDDIIGIEEQITSVDKSHGSYAQPSLRAEKASTVALTGEHRDVDEDDLMSQILSGKDIATDIVSASKPKDKITSSKGAKETDAAQKPAVEDTTKDKFKQDKEENVEEKISTTDDTIVCGKDDASLPHKLAVDPAFDHSHLSPTSAQAEVEDILLQTGASLVAKSSSYETLAAAAGKLDTKPTSPKASPKPAEKDLDSLLSQIQTYEESLPTFPGSKEKQPSPITEAPPSQVQQKSSEDITSKLEELGSDVDKLIKSKPDKIKMEDVCIGEDDGADYAIDAEGPVVCKKISDLGPIPDKDDKIPKGAPSPGKDVPADKKPSDKEKQQAGSPKAVEEGHGEAKEKTPDKSPKKELDITQAVAEKSDDHKAKSPTDDSWLEEQISDVTEKTRPTSKHIAAFPAPTGKSPRRKIVDSPDLSDEDLLTDEAKTKPRVSADVLKSSPEKETSDIKPSPTGDSALPKAKPDESKATTQPVSLKSEILPPEDDTVVPPIRDDAKITPTILDDGKAAPTKPDKKTTTAPKDVEKADAALDKDTSALEPQPIVLVKDEAKVVDQKGSTRREPTSPPPSEMGWIQAQPAAGKLPISAPEQAAASKPEEPAVKAEEAVPKDVESERRKPDTKTDLTRTDDIDARSFKPSEVSSQFLKTEDSMNGNAESCTDSEGAVVHELMDAGGILSAFVPGVAERFEDLHHDEHPSAAAPSDAAPSPAKQADAAPTGAVEGVASVEQSISPTVPSVERRDQGEGQGAAPDVADGSDGKSLGWVAEKVSGEVEQQTMVITDVAKEVEAKGAARRDSAGSHVDGFKTDTTGVTAKQTDESDVPDVIKIKETASVTQDVGGGKQTKLMVQKHDGTGMKDIISSEPAVEASQATPQKPSTDQAAVSKEADTVSEESAVQQLGDIAHDTIVAAESKSEKVISTSSTLFSPESASAGDRTTTQPVEDTTEKMAAKPDILPDKETENTIKEPTVSSVSHDIHDALLAADEQAEKAASLISTISSTVESVSTSLGMTPQPETQEKPSAAPLLGDDGTVPKEPVKPAEESPVGQLGQIAHDALLAAESQAEKTTSTISSTLSHLADSLGEITSTKSERSSKAPVKDEKITEHFREVTETTEESTATYLGDIVHDTIAAAESEVEKVASTITGTLSSLAESTGAELGLVSDTSQPSTDDAGLPSDKPKNVSPAADKGTLDEEPKSKPDSTSDKSPVSDARTEALRSQSVPVPESPVDTAQELPRQTSEGIIQSSAAEPKSTTESGSIFLDIADSITGGIATTSDAVEKTVESVMGSVKAALSADAETVKETTEAGAEALQKTGTDVSGAAKEALKTTEKSVEESTENVKEGATHVVTSVSQYIAEASAKIEDFMAGRSKPENADDLLDESIADAKKTDPVKPEDTSDIARFMDKSESIFQTNGKSMSGDGTDQEPSEPKDTPQALSQEVKEAAGDVRDMIEETVSSVAGFVTGLTSPDVIPSTTEKDQATRGLPSIGSRSPDTKPDVATEDTSKSKPSTEVLDRDSHDTSSGFASFTSTIGSALHSAGQILSGAVPTAAEQLEQQIISEEAGDKAASVTAEQAADTTTPSSEQERSQDEDPAQSLVSPAFDVVTDVASATKDTVSTTLERAGDSILKATTATVGEAERTTDDIGSTIQQAMAEAEKSVEKTIEDTGKDVKEKVKDAREAINKSADDLRKAIAAESDENPLMDIVDETADAIKTAEEVVCRVTSAAQEKAADAKVAISTVKDTAEATIPGAVDELASDVKEMKDEAQTAAGAGKQLIGDVVSSVEDKGASLLASADHAVEQAVTKVASTADSVKDALLDSTKDLKQQLDISTKSAEDLLQEDGAHETPKQVSSAVKSTDETLKSEIKDIGEKVGDMTDIAKDAIGDQTDSVKEDVGTVVKAADDSLSSAVESVKADISSTVTGAEKVVGDTYHETKDIDEAKEALQATLTSKVDDPAEKTEKAAEASQIVLEAKTDEAQKDVQQASSSLFGYIASGIQAVQNTVESVTTGIKRDIISGSGDMTDKAQSAGESIEKEITSSVNDVQDQVQISAQTSKEAVSGVLKDVSDSVETAGNVAIEHLIAGVTQTKEHVESVSDAAEHTLTSSARDAKAVTADAVKAAEATATETVSTSVDSVSDQAKSLATEVKDALPTASKEVKDTTEAAQSSEEELKRAVQDVKERVESTAESSIDAVSHAAGKIADQVASAVKMAEESLELQLKETKGHIDEGAVDLGQSVASDIQDIKAHTSTLAKSTDECVSASVQDIKSQATELASDVKDVNDQTCASTKEILEQVTKEAEDARQQMTSSLPAVADVFKTTSEGISDKIKSAVEETKKDATADIQQVKDSVEAVAKDVKDSLGTGMQEVSAKSDIISKSTEEVPSAAVESVVDKAKSAGKAADDAIETGVKEAQDHAHAGTSVAETVGSGVETIQEQSATVAKAAGDAFTTGATDAQTYVIDGVQDVKELKSQEDKTAAAAVKDVGKKAVEGKTMAEEATATAGEAITSTAEETASQIKTIAQGTEKDVSSEVQDTKKEIRAATQDLSKDKEVKTSITEAEKKIEKVDESLTVGVQAALQQVKTTGEAVDDTYSKAVTEAEKKAQEVASSTIEAGHDAAKQVQETTSRLQEGATKALSSADDQLSSAVKEVEHTVNLGIEKLGQLSREADSQLSQAAQGATKADDDTVRTASETLSQTGTQASDAMQDAKDVASKTASSVTAGVESMIQGVSSGLSEAEQGLQTGAEQAAAEAGEMAEAMYQSAEETLEEASSTVRSTFGGLFGFGRRKSKDTKESKDSKEPETKDVKESPKAEKKTGGGFFSKMFGRRSPEEPPKPAADEPKPTNAERPSPPEQQREAVEELVVRRDIHTPREEDRRSSSELSDIREEASGSSSTREPSSPRVSSSLETAPAGAEGGDPLRRARGVLDPMTSSLHESFHDVMTGSFHEALQDGQESLGLPGVEFRQPRSPPQSLSPSVNQQDGEPDQPVPGWGPPLGLPSPVPPPDHGGVQTPPPTKRAIMSRARASDSPRGGRISGPPPVYLDLVYVPHHANSFYSGVQFFHRVRARYYVFSSIEPSREVFNALLEAKQHWEDKDLEVTIIPTYDTDTLGHWFASNEHQLEELKIDLAPSASRCTINLQDHETSCAAYRLEF